MAMFIVHLAIPAAALLLLGALLMALAPIRRNPKETAPEKAGAAAAAATDVSSAGGHQANQQVRSWALSLPVLGAADLESRLPARKGYDCLIGAPQVALSAVRLEGRVVPPQSGALRAPLADRACVLYSTSAAQARLDGVRAPPMAFDAACCMDFEIELDAPPAPAVVEEGAASPRAVPAPAPPQRVRVRGRDVVLFSMVHGRRNEIMSVDEAPESMQDFVRSRRSPGCALLCGSAGAAPAVEFSECLLDVGARVTCIGGLQRTETGGLLLLPLEPSSEQPGSKLEGSVPPHCQQVGRVLISDDPDIIGRRQEEGKKAAPSKLLGGQSCVLRAVRRSALLHHNCSELGG